MRVHVRTHPLFSQKGYKKIKQKGASELSEYRLEMCDVVKTFPGVKALNHAQLKLKPGTVHALMGENGAGKSTLMKCMFGIYHMDEGKVIYEGQEVQIKGPLDALNRGIARALRADHTDPSPSSTTTRCMRMRPRS